MLNILETYCFVIAVVVCKDSVVLEFLSAMGRIVVRVDDRRAKYPMNVNKINRIIFIEVERFAPSSFVTVLSNGTAANSSFRRMYR